jgi:hypothetical protein
MMPPIPIVRCLRLAVLLTAAILFGNFSRAGTADVLNRRHAKVQVAMTLQERITREILKWPGVLGTAIGVSEAGQPELVVYVDRSAPVRAELIQSTLLQYVLIPARMELTDKFVAYKTNGAQGGNTGISHTRSQKPPIELGTSGGWGSDQANGFCCGGTLGGLIQVNGTRYILSNYHVFESDIVSGSNNLIATNGSPIIQPGLIDIRCNPHRAQNVGTLVKLNSLPWSNVDASLAQVEPGMVSSDGAILEIGPLSSQTSDAFLNQAVKKSGRTSGLTRSYITGLNATISVEYENECGGSEAFTKTFTGQILIANEGGSFLNSGDSGALMVEDIDTNPRAVGLLFAGSSTSAAANPIDEVLQFVWGKMGGPATMVGN